MQSDHTLPRAQHHAEQTKPATGVYPDGTDWRCLKCAYTCDDTGPDRCPNDGAALVRTVAAFLVTR